jgi:hypothetical protein
MRGLAVALAVCFAGSHACAKDFTRTVRSGQPTQMHVYRSWTTDCQSKRGVVKVVSKPAHGTLTPTEVQSTISTSRYHPERTAQCMGLPTNGFRVDYRSEPGFRGTDQFAVEFDYGHGPDVDHYLVNVR